VSEALKETAPAPAPTVAAAPPSGAARRWKDAALALSLSNLCFIRPWFGLLIDVDYGYYNKIPVTAMTLVALLLNLILVAGVFWLLVTWVRRTRNVWLRRLAVLGAGVLFFIPLDFVRLTYLGVGGGAMTVFMRQPLVIAALGVAALLALWWYRLAVRLITAVLAIFLPLTFVSFSKLALLLLGVTKLTQHTQVPPPPPWFAEPRLQPRVVWIIFDEMDYRLCFPERPPYVRMPEFDRLQRESLFATNAYPPSPETLSSLPALLTGLEVSDGVPSGPSELKLLLADTNQSVAWSEQPNIFAQARALRFNTALVGWFHPYDRVLGAHLNFCSWYPYPPFEQSRGDTFGETMLNQLWSALSQVQQRRLHIRLYENSLADALTLVTNRQIGLVFLHRPGPHKPCIYDPARDAFSLTRFDVTRGYFDNLALTDKTLGKLRRAMESAGTWTNTWLIISADHWWRAAHRHDDKVDHRVPFLLKAPGAPQAVTYGTRFNTRATHDLVLAILRGEVDSLDGAMAWLDRHKLDAPPKYRETLAGQ
jgi:hypothetical protein